MEVSKFICFFNEITLQVKLLAFYIRIFFEEEQELYSRVQVLRSLVTFAKCGCRRLGMARNADIKDDGAGTQVCPFKGVEDFCFLVDAMTRFRNKHMYR